MRRTTVVRLMGLSVFLVVLGIWLVTRVTLAPTCGAFACREADRDAWCQDHSLGPYCSDPAGFGACTCTSCVAPAPPYTGWSPASFSGRTAPRISSTLGGAGGSLDSPGGDATVTVPAGALPEGSQLSISQPNQNGLPRGTFVLRGDGDHWDAVSVTDANGNPITSFNPPLTFCFNLTNDEVAHAYPSLSIQKWDGGKWVDVAATFTAGTPNKLCTTTAGW